MEHLRDTLKNLSDLHGAPGREAPVRAYIEETCKAYGASDQKVDRIGNLLVRLPGSKAGGPVVLLDAHMDEPCFMVKYITETGCIHLARLGIVNETVAMGQRVLIHTAKGPVPAAFGTVSFHLAANQEVSTPAFDDLWLDAGFASPEEASAAGVRPGNAVTFDAEAKALFGTRMMGKAFDDRAGCAMLLETARLLAGASLESDVYLSFSVQEEMYARGCAPVIRNLQTDYGVTPDLCIVYDICLSGGYPGAVRHRSPVDLGRGCGIKVYDKSTASHYNYAVPERLLRAMEALAEENGIPYQYDFLYGCTNADIFSTEANGLLAGGISIPCRYTHSPVELVDLTDIKAGVDLTLACIRQVKNLL